MAAKRIHFTENDIRPKNLAKDQHTAFLADVDFLTRERAHFVKVPCPACKANESVQKFKKNGFQYVECIRCATLYMSPRPSPEILGNFYKTSQTYAYWNKYIFPASETIRKEKIFVPRVNRIIELCKKYQVSVTSILEVGAGFGTFCEEMKSRNVFSRVVAIEQNPELSKTLRKKEIETIESPVEEVSFKESERFDVIVSFEVIEHLFSPEDFIASCRKLLAHGGLLILTCPNGKGFDLLVLGKECNSIDHEHLNYFNTTSLAMLVERLGFESKEVTTPGRLDADLVRTKILEGKYDANRDPFLKEILINRWKELGIPFQDFLATHELSSNMWIVARNSQK